jgi:hypothetical protein
MTWNFSFATVRRNLNLRAAIIFATIIAALAGAPPVAAGMIAASDCLPPSLGQYTGSVESYAVGGLGTVSLVDPVHSQFSACVVPLPNVGDTWTESFNSLVSGELFVNGSDLGPAVGPAAVMVSLTVASNAGGVETLNTQMTELNVVLAGGQLIRIDPIIPTTGQTTITDLGGGNYQISSFFDVFTDLSLDGGNTWTPATAPVVMTLGAENTPEPGSIALALGGFLLLGTRKLLRR